jgi:hypothetical protein
MRARALRADGMRYCVRFGDRKPEMSRPMSKSANYRIHAHSEYIVRYYNNMCKLISQNSNGSLLP